MPEDLPRLDTTPRKSVQEEFHGTLYPYQDFKYGWVGSVLNPIRRIIYPINPFASQQVPTHDSVGNYYFPLYKSHSTINNTVQ